MMDREEMLFFVIWGLNFLISILCFLWKAKENKTTWRMRLAVMVLCPVIGPLFFACSQLVYRTIFRQEVDLEDVIFSKERIKTHLKADEERERNMVPIEEALAVSDRKNLRMLMMNVIRGDLKDSLESIMLAFM